VGGIARRRMAEAIRQGLMHKRSALLGAAPLGLLFALPLLFSLLMLAPGLVDIKSFYALTQHPQFWGGLSLTLFTGISSTVLALFFAVLVVMGAGARTGKGNAFFLALPHLALALGLGLVLAPTGLLARLFVGGSSPPDWQMVQDPAGLGLIVALVLKETPFIVWAMSSVLYGDELHLRFQQEAMVARSLGHGPRSTFFKVILPQVLPRIIWPMVAVFSYGITVVDMALVIGPAQPPTLAPLIWIDLNDGETIANLRGAAGTVVLSGMLGLMILATWMLLKIMRPFTRYAFTRPARIEHRFGRVALLLAWMWFAAYAVIVFALLLQSVAQHWPYPQLLASAFSFKAWASALANLTPLFTSLLLAIASSCLSLCAVVAWLETQSPKRDRFVLPLALVMLCVPALLVSLGQYRLLLLLGLTGTWGGLLLAHLLPVMAYVFVMLQGPYRGYDGRWQAVGLGLGAERFRFLRSIKWPMLKASLLSAWAVGFSVSAVQFVPAQLAAAGRFSTLPMEAVTLSSGGNRALMSVYGLLMMLLPIMGFGLAAWFSRSRWRDA
jgi:putative thiamine transport system permease protein